MKQAESTLRRTVVIRPVILTIALVAVVVGAWWRTSVLREAAIADWEEQLSEVATMTGSAVDAWLAERRGDVAMLASATALFQSPPSVRPRDTRLDGVDRRGRLSVMTNMGGNVAAWVVDGGGRVLAASAADAVPPPEVRALAARVSATAEADSEGPWIMPDGRLLMAFAAPIEPSGLIALLLADPSYVLTPLLESTPVLAESNEYRIVARVDTNFVVFSTATPDSVAVAIRTPSSVSRLSAVAIERGDSFGEFAGRDGTPFVGATHSIVRGRWGVVAQLERREVLASANAQAIREALIALSVLGLIAVGMIAQARSSRHERLMATASSEARLRAVVDAALDAVITMDMNGLVTSWNRRAEAVFGWTADEVVGQPMASLIIPPRYRDAHAAGLARFVSTGEGAAIGRLLGLSALRRDGTEFPVELFITATGEPKGLAFVGFVRDVTERDLAEAARRKSEQAYQGLFEHATFGIYRASTDGRFLAVNAALVRLLGHEHARELMDRPVIDLYADPAERGRLMARFATASAIHGVEARWKRKDGVPITVRLTGRIMRDADEQIEAYEMFVEDVTERRSIEAQLRQAQKMEAVGQLTGGIAHDFNNLLTILLTNTDLALAGTAPEAADVRANLGEMREAALRGADMIKKLMTVSRREPLAFTAVDLSSVCDDAVAMFRRLLPASIDLRYESPNGPTVVRGDRGAINQMLLNFATNARDAMPEGGMLTLAIVSPTTLPAKFGTASGSARYSCIVIEDTGVGMSPDTLAHAFDPFYTTKPVGQGTGLGLAMAYALVKQHGGFIDVTSAPAAGTSFRVYLPLLERAPDDANTEMSTDAPGGYETILFVEDEPALRRTVPRILERFGYTVLVAADGEEAIQVLQAGSPRIDLVISDIEMPRIGGESVVAATDGAVKVLLISGNPPLTVSSPDATVPFLAKPFLPADLLTKIREVLGTPKK